MSLNFVRRAFLCLVGCLLSTAAVGLDALGPLAAIAKRHHIPASDVSALVHAVDASEPLLAINTTLPRNPASTIKLVTTFVALDRLGPNYTWPTEIYALGAITDGVLKGDLLLKGYGDPYLIEENLWKMAGALRRTGLRHITGNLVIDDSHFAPPARDPGAFDGQALRLYNVQPSALMVNFKAVSLIFTPRTDGQGVRIEVEPALAGLRVVNQLKLERGRCRGVLATVKLAVENPAEVNGVVVSGRYQTGCGEQRLLRSFMTPTAYAHSLFHQVWQQWGGRLDGGGQRGQRPAAARLLLKWQSPPLAEVIRPLNKWSNNVMADALFYTLGGTLFDPPITPQHGESVIKAYLASHEISTANLVMENGSGLSRISRISAQTMNDMLRYAYRSRFMPEYLASLSVVGIDGTLRRYFKRTDERGWMHLKTGHLNQVAAVAGYVRTQSGKTLAVTLLLNGRTEGASALIETFLAWAYRQ